MIVFIENLDQLRQRIKGIDYSIMALVSQRINLALQIGDLKRQSNLPVKNFQVEKQVLERIKIYADEFGLDAVFSTKLFQNIISQSVNAQVMARNQHQDNSGTSVLVIGGLGNMGSWFVSFLQSTGFDVSISDPLMGDKNIDEEKYGEFEYIFVCVPLHETKQVLENLINKRIESVIFEISSLKSHINDTLKKARKSNMKIHSIHPLFGPQVSDLSGRNLLVCRTNGCDRIMNDTHVFFGETMINIQDITLEDHDKLMLYSLGLSHFINILNGLVLSNSGIEKTQLDLAASTTFNKQIRTTIEVFEENPQLYFSIQTLNDHRDELYSQIEEAFTDISNAIRTNNLNRFSTIMEDVNTFFKRGDSQ
ncbi:MAG: prephenate dehydrogenase/arogenate dehydrogenase family protein [Candidatus Heimdallarchaeota archaeon]|nr:prephenate dehydrogenase/arogenate dehydrogenase family protein [Candidatus Heimdallarchaeota archaeon]